MQKNRQRLLHARPIIFAKKLRMDLGQRIAMARKEKGLTQEQLADLANVTVRTIQRIESGESVPRAYTLKTIAAALDTPFEDLNGTGNEQLDSLTKASHPTNSFEEESGKHFLQVLCLSCFSYLVIPFVHFLVPRYLLKKSKEQNPKVIAFARKVIRGQLYWKSGLWFVLLVTLAYNFINAAYFQKSQLLNYLWPFFIMYILNGIIITVNLLQLRKADFSFQPSSLTA